MQDHNRLFISYAHIDNEALIPGKQGWITTFHKALEVRLAQLRGKRPDIWRDQKLQGNDLFGDEIVDQFPNLGFIISIFSPRYLTSEWCVKELQTFVKTTRETGGHLLANKSRIFKVVKTPIPLEDQPAEVQGMLGYEFYHKDSESGRIRELNVGMGTEMERLYWGRLDDLAYDISEAMTLLENEQAKTSQPETSATPSGEKTNAPSEEKTTIYLAPTARDLKNEWDGVKRDLLNYGYKVLPEDPIPYELEEAEKAVTEDLELSQMAIHMVGKNYGLVPEGTTESIQSIQVKLSVESAYQHSLQRLIWSPPELNVEDERQVQFIEKLETSEEAQKSTDYLITPLEEFKAAIHTKLKEKERPEPEKETQDDAPPMIYLICEQRDMDQISTLEDYLYEHGAEVFTPVFEGEEEDIRQDHQENLTEADAILFYYGNANELWLRAKLRELQKVVGYGREKPLLAKAVYIAEPMNPRKKRYRTHDALILHGGEQLNTEKLKQFLNILKQKS